MFALESDALWSKVTDAIVAGDQQLATDEKANIEQAQRDAAAIRAEKNMVHHQFICILYVDQISISWLLMMCDADDYTGIHTTIVCPQLLWRLDLQMVQQQALEPSGDNTPSLML